MSSLDALSVSAPREAPGLVRSTRGLIRWVCTKNPFYVLSALVFLVGLWISFGAQDRDEQTWALMSGMACYTLLLAVPACLLVRFGGVWEDVRTVLLLVVLMFLATSVTFDETLARSPGLGINCYGAGLLFAVGLSAGMLRAMRLVLPGWFRAAYYLALALFFLYPVALVPLLDRPRSEALQWALFGFSPLAGLVALTLLPAIRRGRAYVQGNGSPWRWPLYPWSLFVFLGFGAASRSFLLCWSMQHVERIEPEPTIFGPYFLVPLLLAVAVLLLELGLVERSRAALRLALALPLGLVVLAMLGDRADDLYQGFLSLFVARLGGTPLYLTLLAAAGFYAYAWLRRVPGATGGVTCALAVLAVVAPTTRDLHGLELAAPQPWPLLAIAALQLGLGIVHRSAARCLVGAGCLIAVVAQPHRGPVAFHLALAVVLVLGAAFEDAFGRILRNAGAALGLLACLAVLFGRFDRPDFAPAWTVTAYPLLVSGLLAGYARLLRHRFSGIAANLALAAWMAVLTWRSYCSLRHVVLGLDFIATGLVLLALAEGISLAKAGLIPWRVARRPRKLPGPAE
jgi:hypothetical protein